MNQLSVISYQLLMPILQQFAVNTADLKKVRYRNTSPALSSAGGVYLLQLAILCNTFVNLDRTYAIVTRPWLVRDTKTLLFRYQSSKVSQNPTSKMCQLRKFYQRRICNNNIIFSASPISYFILHTSYFLLLTFYFLLHTSYFLLFQQALFTFVHL